MNPNVRIAVVAVIVIFFDQVTKFLVYNYLGFAEDKVIFDGFFKLVHWGNTGAAWSMFRGNNRVLTLVALGALIVLVRTRHHFDMHTLGGQVSLGLIFGGIMGNLIDRVRVKHVIDILYFYVNRRDGQEAGFPAFNVADSAICIGVGLLFILSWQSDGSRQVSPSLGSQ